MPTQTDVRNALGAKQSQALSELIGALDAPTQGAVTQWSTYERESAFLQTVKLGEGDDCNYDRPTVGIAYSTWYMPRRINEALYCLLPLLVEREGSDLAIVDIGCGTGATWWACRYIAQAMKESGMTPPSIKISACDTSLPMLQLGRSMWDGLDSDSREAIDVSTELASWTTIGNLPDDGVIFASYLFDQSDKHRIEELGKTLRRMADQFRSTDVYIIGASNKKVITDSCVASFKADGQSWKLETTSAFVPVWNGQIPELKLLRQQFAQGCSGKTKSYSESLEPTWADSRADMKHLRRVKRRGESAAIRRSTFVLDPKQDAAAQPDGRLTAILGAAGSGKSRVLVERVARTVLADIKQGGKDIEYLVTCFNVAVVDQLRRWFVERLEFGSDTKNLVDFKIQGETVIVQDLSRLNPDTTKKAGNSHPTTQLAKIHFTTWDATIYRHFRSGGINPGGETEIAMQRIIELWGNREKDNRLWLDQNPWATPKFVLQELKRVIYGQGISTLEEYLNVERRGRPREPQMRKERREGLWKLLNDPKRQKLWVDRRIAAHRSLRHGFVPEGFDWVFLDECQDFVETDFHLISALVKDPKQLVVSGDGTQALQTGPGYFRPRSVGGARWMTHELSGSYRLPIRICEAIEPIAKAIQKVRKGQATNVSSEEDEGEDIALPQAVKSAVIGCRPIVLASPNHETFASQLAEVLNYVAPLVEIDGECVVTNADEQNRTLANLIGRVVTATQPKYKLENNSMLKIKGLERPCVLFSTRLNSELTPGASIYEWTYTILTRPTSVLILFLSQTTDIELQALIGRLRRDCLFFWDRVAEQMFDQFAKTVGSTHDPFK
jgi:hypothetical protein